MSAHRLKGLLLKILVVALSLTALLAILVLVFGTDDDLILRLLVSSLFVALFSLTGLCAGVGYERGRKTFGATGIVASVLAAAYTMLLVWEVLPVEEVSAVKPAAVLGIVAGAMAYSSLVLLSHGKTRRVDAIVLATVGLILTIAALLIVILVGELEPPEWVGRLLGVVGILAVLGTLLGPILNKVASLQAAAPAPQDGPAGTES